MDEARKLERGGRGCDSSHAAWRAVRQATSVSHKEARLCAPLAGTLGLNCSRRCCKTRSDLKAGLSQPQVRHRGDQTLKLCFCCALLSCSTSLLAFCCSLSSNKACCWSFAYLPGQVLTLMALQKGEGCNHVSKSQPGTLSNGRRHVSKEGFAARSFAFSTGQVTVARPLQIQEPCARSISSRKPKTPAVLSCSTLLHSVVVCELLRAPRGFEAGINARAAARESGTDRTRAARLDCFKTSHVKLELKTSMHGCTGCSKAKRCLIMTFDSKDSFVRLHHLCAGIAGSSCSQPLARQERVPWAQQVSFKVRALAHPAVLCLESSFCSQALQAAADCAAAHGLACQLQGLLCCRKQFRQTILAVLHHQVWTVP